MISNGIFNIMAGPGISAEQALRPAEPLSPTPECLPESLSNEGSNRFLGAPHRFFRVELGNCKANFVL